MKSPIRFTLCLFLLGVLIGCQATATPAPSPTPTIAAARTPGPAVAPTPLITPVSGPLTLTWWTPELLSPKAAQPAGPLLARYLSEYEAAHNQTVRVNVVVKARYGRSGLLDYVRAAQPVAPALLPDLIALDVTELEQAAALKLLQPLDALLSAPQLAALYPFARQAGRFGNQQLAVQYLADVEHALFQRAALSEPVQTWAGLAASRTPYLFPASSPAPAAGAGPAEELQHSLLSQYLAAGGALDASSRRLSLAEQPLQRLLAFYEEGRQAGILPDNLTEIASVDDAWKAFGEGWPGVVLVSARRYLTMREGLKDAGYAVAPGWSGPAPAIASGWALAIVTTDPPRQRAAAEFLAWLLAAERNGAVAQAAGWLPTQPAALAAAGAGPYYEFLDAQLSAAVARPAGADYPATAARLARAAGAVLKGTSTAAEALQAAMNPPK
jgi:ABC-type glycerol-3-phosphate transport system substrate-binding protein